VEGRAHGVTWAALLVAEQNVDTALDRAGLEVAGREIIAAQVTISKLLDGACVRSGRRTSMCCRL